MLQLILIAAPVSLMYLGLMLMGFVDLVMVGRLGAAEVGGVGVGNSFYSWVMIVGVGFISGMDFPAAHAIGAKNPERAFRVFVQGLWISIIGGSILAAFCVLSTPLFQFMKMNSEVRPLAEQYLRVVAFSLPFVFILNACRSYLQAFNIVQPFFWILVIGNILNYLLLRALLFGDFGFADLGYRLGYDGAAWATFYCRIFMAILSLGLVVTIDARSGKFLRKVGLAFHSEIFRVVIRLGFPAAMQMLLEVGMFSLSTVLAARFSADSLAAHQIVLTTASMAFMIPLGISMALSSLVGQAIGANNLKLSRDRAVQGFILGLIMMAFTSSTMLIFPDFILNVFRVDENVVEIAKSLLWVAGLFQFSDALQVIGAGALRGTGNTKWAAYSNAVGHWLVGFPVGMYLAFYGGKEVFGLWIGLSVGLTVVAALIVYGWYLKTKAFRVSS